MSRQTDVAFIDRLTGHMFIGLGQFEWFGLNSFHALFVSDFSSRSLPLLRLQAGALPPSPLISPHGMGSPCAPCWI